MLMFTLGGLIARGPLRTTAVFHNGNICTTCSSEMQGSDSQVDYAMGV